MNCNSLLPLASNPQPLFLLLFVILVVFLLFSSNLQAQEELEATIADLEASLSIPLEAEEEEETYAAYKDQDPLEELEQANGLKIHRIVFETEEDFVTDKELILKEIGIEAGDYFNLELFQNGVQRFVNFNVLYQLDYELYPTDEGELDIVLKPEEKWTLLPIFKFEQNGDEIELVLGGYEMNFLGMLVEVGGAYIRKGDFNLFSAWYYNPRLFSTKTMLTVVLFRKGFTDTYYQMPLSYSDSSENRLLIQRQNSIYQQLERVRFGGYIEVGREFDIGINITTTLRYVIYSETLDYLRDPDTASIEYLISMLTANILLGEIDFIENYKYDGHRIHMLLSVANNYMGSQRNLIRFFISYTGFFDLFDFLNLGYRIATGQSLAADRYQQYFIGSEILENEIFGRFFGGLNTTRGLIPTMIHGENLLLFNVEARFLLFKGILWWELLDIALQLALFYDVGSAWQNPYFFGKVWDGMGMTVGANFALTFTKIANFFIIIGSTYRIKPLDEFQFLFRTSHFF